MIEEPEPRSIGPLGKLLGILLAVLLCCGTSRAAGRFRLSRVRETVVLQAETSVTTPSSGLAGLCTARDECLLHKAVRDMHAFGTAAAVFDGHRCSNLTPANIKVYYTLDRSHA